MSIIMDKIKTNQMLGESIRRIRKEKRLRTVDIAERSGRSRDILHRLENGRDISVSALLDILSAAGLAITLVPAGIPTMEQMREAFADDLSEDHNA